MMEIGSEYWIEQKNIGNSNSTFNHLVSFGDDRKLLFSGRTAIDYVLEDIETPINSVYMPSYCCDSMLQPFIDRGIKIEFYEVVTNEKGISYNIDYHKKVDLFFANSYFGYTSTTMDQIVEEFKRKKVRVIEDITHRLLCKRNFCEQADYVIASLRKWFPIPSGGIAIKGSGLFKEISLTSPSNELIDNKISAMKKKAAYIEGSKNQSDNSNSDKSGFLSYYADFNRTLKVNYKLISIDPYSEKMLERINIPLIKEQRLKNANYIYRNLELSNDIRLLLDLDSTNDCPLFLPLLVNKEKREILKQHLVSNDIYCPVHWPIPQILKDQKVDIDIYDKELSLICDHRYRTADINRQISRLGDFKDIL